MSLDRVKHAVHSQKVRLIVFVRHWIVNWNLIRVMEGYEKKRQLNFGASALRQNVPPFTYLGLIVCTVGRSVVVLSSFCRRSGIVLSSFCRRSVIVLSSFCYRSVVVLSSFCHRSVIVLSSFCRRSDVILLSLCRRFVVVLSAFGRRSVVNRQV